MQSERLEKMNEELRAITLEHTPDLGTFPTIIPGLSLSRREQMDKSVPLLVIKNTFMEKITA